MMPCHTLRHDDAAAAAVAATFVFFIFASLLDFLRRHFSPPLRLLISFR